MAKKCIVCSKFAKPENLVDLPENIANKVESDAQACNKCSEKSEAEIMEILMKKGKITMIDETTVETNVEATETTDTVETTTVEEITEVATEVTPEVTEAPKVDPMNCGIEWVNLPARKGVTNFQLIPVLKKAVDENDWDTINKCKELFPAPFESTLKYLGAKRQAKIEAGPQAEVTEVEASAATTEDIAQAS